MSWGWGEEELPLIENIDLQHLLLYLLFSSFSTFLSSFFIEHISALGKSASFWREIARKTKQSLGELKAESVLLGRWVDKGNIFATLAKAGRRGDT